MKTLLLLFIISVCLSCCSSSRQPDETKMDAPLKLRLSGIKSANSEEIIQVLGKSSSEINPELKSKLIETGADIQSTAGNIFTAGGTHQEISDLSLLEFVIYLELAQKNEIK